MNKQAILIGIFFILLPVIALLQLLTWVGRNTPVNLVMPDENVTVINLGSIEQETTTTIKDLTKMPPPKEVQTIVMQPKAQWEIQLGAFSKKNLAEALKNRLTAKQYSTYIREEYRDGTTLYLVRMGPFNQRYQAELLVKEIKETEQLNSLIYRKKEERN